MHTRAHKGILKVLPFWNVSMYVSIFFIYVKSFTNGDLIFIFLFSTRLALPCNKKKYINI